MTINYSEQQLATFETFNRFNLNNQLDVIVEALAGTGKTFTLLHGLKHIDPSMSILVAAFNRSIKEEFSAKVAKLYQPNVVARWQNSGYQVVGVENNTAFLKPPSGQKSDGKYVKLERRPLDCPVDVTTWHSYGFKLVKAAYGFCRVDNWRSYILAYNAVAPKFDLEVPRPKGRVEMPSEARRVISLVKQLHSRGRSINPFATVQDLIDLALRFDIMPTASLESAGFNLDTIAQLALSAMKAAGEGPSDGKIDYDDMIFLPVYNGLVSPSHDVVMVDERQDLNLPMLQMAREATRNSLVLIGDTNQAIYGFRGADSEFANDLEKTGAEVLHLTCTYRCGKAIVDVAKGLVPEYEAHKGNCEGRVSYVEAGERHDRLIENDFDISSDTHPDLDIDRPDVGDAILSRYNAPLIHLVLGYMKRGIPAYMRGNDFCEQCKNIIDTVTNGKGDSCSIPDLLKLLNVWETEQSERILAKCSNEDAAQNLLEAMRDKADTVRTLAEESNSVRQLKATLDRIFREIDAGRAITLSSIHRAKGLEWRRVFLLSDTLRHREGRTEEKNIAYVGVTRAIEHLIIVNGYEGMFDIQHEAFTDDEAWHDELAKLDDTAPELVDVYKEGRTA